VGAAVDWAEELAGALRSRPLCHRAHERAGHLRIVGALEVAELADWRAALVGSRG
jgi:hypothetical protein